jgi:hypothetical protein
MSTDSDIRAGLHALAERAGPPSLDGDDLAGLVVREERSRRRRHLGVVAAAVAVAVVATAVPFALNRDPAPRGQVTTPVLRSADVYGLPTRGSLADDEQFVEAVRRAPWRVPSIEGVPDAPLETRRVVFAGEVGGERLALVVGENTESYPDGDAASASELAAAWFVGTAGGMELYGVPHGIREDVPTGLVAPGGELVVVAVPGDDVEVSERPEVDADGSRSRVFSPVETSADGIAVHPLERPSSGKATSVPLWNAVSYRVTRDGALVVRATPDRTLSEAIPDIALRMEATRPISEGAAGVARELAIGILTLLGRTDLDTDVAVQWAGPLPGAQPATAAVVTVTLPNGALVVAADVRVDDPNGGYVGTSCGVEARPAGAPAEDRIYATACPSPTGFPETTLVVVAPLTVASVRVYDADGDVVSEHPATDGVVTVPLPPGAAVVEGLTAGGVSLGRSDLLAQVDLLGN